MKTVLSQLTGILQMALSVDRANVLFDEICSGLRPLRDGLILLGLIYAAKVTVSLSCGIFNGIRIFGLSRLWNPDFKKKYGKWAVVTGCTKGIGKAYVDALASRGMNVVLIGRAKHLLEAQKLETIDRYNVEVEIVVADFAQGKPAYDSIRISLDSKDIGILVNNVGIISEYPMFLTESSEQFLWDLVNVNMGAATIMTRIVMPGMESRNRGAIINLASSAALSPQPLVSAYTASKAYVDFFSEALSYEASRKGITVQTVVPFYISTRMTEFSDMLNKPSFFVPSAEDFVKSAIRTLGLASRTTGYWPHALQYFFSSLTPRSWYIYGSFLLNKKFRSGAKRSA